MLPRKRAVSLAKAVPQRLYLWALAGLILLIAFMAWSSAQAESLTPGIKEDQPQQASADISSAMSPELGKLLQKILQPQTGKKQDRLQRLPEPERLKKPERLPH